MKINFKTKSPPTSVSLLCKVQWENEVYFIVAFYNGKEYVSPETRRVVKGTVVGWESID